MARVSFIISVKKGLQTVLPQNISAAGQFGH